CLPWNFWRRTHDIRILRPVAQRMVHQYQRQHCLSDRSGANAYAGIVSAMGLDYGRIPALVYRASRQPNAGSGFNGDIHDNILAGGNSAHYASRVVAQKTFRRDLVGMLSP